LGKILNIIEFIFSKKSINFSISELKPEKKEMSDFMKIKGPKR